MSRRGLVRAREENWKSDRLTGILPGKPDLVKVEWDSAAGSAPSDRNAELSRFARRRDFAFFRSKSQSANDSHSSNRKRPGMVQILGLSGNSTDRPRASARNSCRPFLSVR